MTAPSTTFKRGKANELEDQLSQAIQSGHYRVHSPIPSVRELAKSFGVHYNTVQTVIKRLSARGLVISIKRRGVFVAGNNAGTSAPSVPVSGSVAAHKSRAIGPMAGGPMAGVPMAGPMGGPMGIMCIEALASERQNHDYQLIRSIETIATEAGRPIFRYDLNPQALANPDRLIEHCLADGLSGVVIVGVRDTEPLEPILTQLRDRNIPVAVCPLGRQSVAAGIQVTIINADDQLAGVVAAQHLYELGHRNLAVVSYQRSRPYIEQRIAGVQAVCQRHGLVSEADQFIRLPVKEMSASEHQRVGFEAFALLPAGTTGVFCMNDSVAAGLIEAAMKSGHQIGKTLSVVGHDSDVRYDDKQITTVVPPLAQIARWACDLLKVSAGSSTEIQRSERILLRPQLVWRRSTGPRGK